MRFDEINLIGDFKIDGFTGTSGQAIGFSGSTVEWINAASGGSQNQLSSSGYNYIIVTATGNAIENGINLINDYAQLSSLNIGGLSETNRLTLFLTPGVYDLSSNGPITVISYIDIIGLGRNPLDVRIQAGSSTYTIDSADVDFSLENVHLVGDKTWRDGGTTSYFRWKNLVIGGVIFNGVNFANLNGEFKNIKVLDGANFAHVTGSIDGTYEDIEIGSVANAFRCVDSMGGNYKNITIDGISSNGFYSSGGQIIINFLENLKVYNFTGTNLLVAVGNIQGIFKNISIPNNAGGKIFSTNSLGDLGSPSSRFENIQMGNVSSAFSDINTINGIFKSIQIGNCDNVFTIIEIFDQDVEFEDIKIGNCTQVFTNDNDDISGKFRNITIGNISGDRVFASITNLSGDFKNISIGSASGNVFSATNSIVSTFKNIEVGNVGNDLFCTPLFNSNITGLKAGNIGNSFIQTNTLDGELKDIEIGNITYRSLYADSTIVATFSDIKMGNVLDNGPIYSGSTIGGSVKNFEAGNVAGFLIADNGFGSGYLAENIKFGNSSVSVFSSNTSGGITESVKNVKMGDITGTAFFAADSGGVFSGTFENIEINSISGGNCFYTNNSSFQNLTVRKLTIGTVSGNVLTSDQTTNPLGNSDSFDNVTIKDVELGSADAVFRTATNMRIRNSRFENITISTCSTVFRSIIDENTEIKNLYSTGNFGYDFTSSAKLINSNLNMSDRNFGPSFSQGTIDRTKIVTDVGFTVSLTSTIFSLYSIYSYAGLTAAGYSYSNIVDSDVTF